MYAAYPLVLAIALFSIGIYGVLSRRHAILVLLSLELMLAGANLAVVTAGALWPDAQLTGQVFAIFVLTIAAAEVGVGLAVILLLYRLRGSSDLSSWRGLQPVGDTDRDDQASDEQAPVASTAAGATAAQPSPSLSGGEP